MEDFTPEQQAFIDSLVGKARIEGREKAKEEAAAKAAEAGKSLQELADQRQARIAELEPLESQIEAYEGLVAGMLKDAVIELGEAASKAVGGLPETMTTIEKLKWLHENEGLFQASGGPIGTPRRAAPAKPKTEGPVEISRFPIRL